MTARRVNPHPPTIDGRLDDEVWQHAPVAAEFVQREPDEGQPAAQPTTVQVAYDDEALYLGITCYDSAPDSIVARLTRRDQWAERDWVEVEPPP